MIYTDIQCPPDSREIQIYTHANSPYFDSEEEWTYWVSLQGEIILQVQCTDGTMFIIRSWDVRETLEFDKFFRNRN